MNKSQCGCERDDMGVLLPCNRLLELEAAMNRAYEGGHYIGQRLAKMENAAEREATRDAYIHHRDLALCDHKWANIVINPMQPAIRMKVTYCVKCNSPRDGEYHNPDLGYVADWMKVQDEV